MTKARALAKILKGSTGSRAGPSSRSRCVAGRDRIPQGLFARQPNRERCDRAVTFAVVLSAIWFRGGELDGEVGMLAVTTYKARHA